MARTVLDLLRLLADRVDRVDPVGGRADGAGRDGRAGELEHAATELAGSEPEAGALVLRIRSAMEAGRRRETELAALVETARELTSQSDTGGVLDAIVRRARALLGTDLAYLTLFDADRGDTYMRATAGSVSPRFQALRLPLGAGLGGLVAATRNPHWTGNYGEDERYRHTEEIDAAVGEEGLVAICGVPLLVDAEFVGVLFAANRSARPFAPEEVALLGSLAALAAVSLVQTRQLADTAAALEALRTAHAAIAEAAAAHDRFAGVVLEGGAVAYLAEALARLLGTWVVVLDAEGAPAARFGEPPDAGCWGEAVRAADGAPSRLARAGRVWAAAVVAAGQRLGTLLLGGVPELGAGQVRTVERAAMVTALVLLFGQREAEADRRERAEVLAELLAVADRPRPAVVTRLEERGVAARRPHVLLVCRCPPARRRAVLRDAAAAGGR
ncbi:GAF domain-containing protein, partial [Pseudonocardia lutea]